MSNIACRSLRWVACWRKLSREHPGKTKWIPSDVRIEAVIAERLLSDVTEVNGLGSQVPYNCPNCGGVLWEIHDPSMTRYRCHTGHFLHVAVPAHQSIRKDRKNPLGVVADV